MNLKSKSTNTPPDADLLEVIYEAAGDETKWENALSRIGSRVDGVSAMYALFSSDSSRSDLKPIFVSGYGHPEERATKYIQEAHLMDPHIPLSMSLPEQDWLLSHQHFSTNYIRFDPFFQEVMIPMGIRWMAGTRLWEADNFVSALAFHRAHEAAPFNDKQMQKLAILTPHLSRASRLNAQLIKHQMDATLGMAALNNVSFGIAILHENGRIVFCNTVAEKLFSNQEVFTLELSGRMALRNISSQHHLQSALASALQLQSTAVVLADNFGKPVIYAMMVPLPPASRWNTAWQRPLAMLAMRKTDDSCETVGQMWGYLFKLTHAEQQLAQWLLTGRSIEEYAVRRGVSKETVRSQLKSILAKTGTHRQIELITLLGKLPNVVSNPKE